MFISVYFIAFYPHPHFLLLHNLI